VLLRERVAVVLIDDPVADAILSHERGVQPPERAPGRA
jgi:hypothetical protein